MPLRFDTRDAALEWVNAVRQRYGLAPLSALRRGRRMQKGACPVARSLWELGAWVSGVSAELRATGEVVRIDPMVAAFIMQFDSGRYQDLNEAVP